MQNTVTLTKFEALEKRIEQLKAALKSKNNQINNVSDNMKTLNRSSNKFQKHATQELLEKEIYDKRFNLLFHGIEEDTESASETKWKSENNSIFAKWPKNSKFSRSSCCRCRPFTAASYHQKR